ncbi:hypothetical protein, partial [Planococcus glaciei]|uniref:hypothetical protein n=1 Tax=Planococcus glaciei TaxID=459472 RepID=UPI00055A8B44
PALFLDCRETWTVLFISLQADAFHGLAPSRFVALRLQGLDGFAFPQKRHWPKPARTSLCDEASGAMQEQWFFAAFRFFIKIHVKRGNEMKYTLVSCLLLIWSKTVETPAGKTLGEACEPKSLQRS